MQIPIINGIYTDENSEIRTSYPVNMVPVPKVNGISSGYLRPMDGIVKLGTGPGLDRGAINWKGVCYRVMSTQLISVDSNGNVTTIGTIPGTDQVTMDYGFDYLAIAADGKLFLYDGTTLAQNVDTDLGLVLDVVWADGYFVTTDGNFIVVTELGNPFAVNPLKYGSAEANPDDVVGVLRIRTEVYAINRYSIEVFDNVGGDFFPFQRIDGAQMLKGAIGTQAATIYLDAVAFLGGGINEAPAIWLGINASTSKISTREIDTLLQNYTQAELEAVLIETRTNKSNEHLLVHLPDRTLVYDGAASQQMQTPVWFTLTSGIEGFNSYRARNFVWCYDKWIIGDSIDANIGYLSESLASQYGELTRWEFGTTIIYNEGNGAIFHELELIALTGRSELGINPAISTQYSTDGEVWSQEKYISSGKQGQRNKRLIWLGQGFMRKARMQRFKGFSDSMLSAVRLEARLEPLAY